MSVIQDVPRSALRAGLWVTRLPLTVVASLRGDRADVWPPVVMFDGFAAGVREFAGGVLHDDELVEAARLERARVSELKRAAELETVAAATRERADAELDEERSRAEEQRERVARETAAREAALEREQARKREQVNAAAEKREESVRTTEARTKEQLAKQKRATRKARLQAEREVLQDEHAAVAAQGAAVDADRELRATKAARRSSRPDA
jgi:colicin import membrane protein